MADEDDDLFEDDDPEDPAPEEEAPAPPAEPEPEKPAPADNSANEMAAAALDALKGEYAEAAKAAGYTAANFEAIGLKGVGADAKAAFVAEAKKSHEARVAELTAQGFTYNPEAAKESVEETKLTEMETAAKAAWGAMGPGQPAAGDEQLQKIVEDEVKAGDTMGVIGTLLSKGGLGEFVARGKRE